MSTAPPAAAPALTIAAFVGPLSVDVVAFLPFVMPTPIAPFILVLSLRLVIVLEVSDLESSRPRMRAGGIVQRSIRALQVLN